MDNFLAFPSTALFGDDSEAHYEVAEVGFP